MRKKRGRERRKKEEGRKEEKRKRKEEKWREREEKRERGKKEREKRKLMIHSFLNCDYEGSSSFGSVPGLVGHSFRFSTSLLFPFIFLLSLSS